MSQKTNEKTGPILDKKTSGKTELEKNTKKCVFCGNTKVYAKVDGVDAYVCVDCYSCLDPEHY